MIKGKKVGLRAIEREDLPILRDWRNLEYFRRNMREFRELNMAMQEKWYENIVLNSANDFMFLIVELSSKKPIGVCGLVYVNWIVRSADVSLYIGDGEKYIDDEGLAEESATLLLRYGFEILNLHKAWTELYEFDVKKITFFSETLGFTRDGVFRDNCFDEGKYFNSYLYSTLAEEWFSRSRRKKPK